MSTSPDVVVVGAGPVGLVAATELARRGVRIRIIDKLTCPTDESRAIAVHARSLDMFSRMGIVEQLTATGIKAVAMQVYTGGKRLFRVPLSHVDSAFPYTVVTAQTETERVLTEHLLTLGGTVERGVELASLAQDETTVQLSLRTADCGTEDVTTSWVVGADGAHSTVRHLLGTRLTGSFEGERFLLADVDADHELDMDSMHTFFAPDGPVAVFPMINHRLRIIAQTPREATQSPTQEQAQAVLDTRVGGITITHPHWLTSFEIHHAQVPSYRWGRVFLAGDAAHIHSPAGGQGMNTGMQDAFNLGWKLASAIEGSSGGTLLDSYHAERYPVAAQVISFSDRLTRMGTLSGPAQRVRDAAMRVLGHVGPVTRQLAALTEEVGIGYPDSPIADGLTGGGSHVVAGQHLPHVVDEALQKQITDLCRVDGHTVLTVATRQVAPAAGGPGPRQVLVTGSDIPVAGYDAVIADPEGLLATRLGLKSGGRVVVRPDGYVGAVSSLSDPAQITEYFARITN